MGLDMWLEYEDGITEDNELNHTEFAYWRKHWDLHNTFFNIWQQENQTNDAAAFNCERLLLNEQTIQTVIDIVENDFYETEPEYLDSDDYSLQKHRDLSLLNSAKTMISHGNKVYYTSWW